MLPLTKLAVEQHFAADGIDVSWPWFNYTYGCDWDLYILTTYTDQDGDYQTKDLYAEAYPFAGQYALCYLTMGNDVFLDTRHLLPQTLYASAVNAVTAEPSATPEPQATPVPRETAIPENTEAPKETSTPKVTITPQITISPEVTAVPEETPASTAAPTHTPEPVPVRLAQGAKGDEVQRLQQRLIALDLPDSPADGDFGKKTAAAVEALQKAHGLEVTGIFTDAAEAVMSEEMRKYALSAIQVAMTIAQPLDVFTLDGNALDPSKFHDYAYTGTRISRKAAAGH